MTDIIKRKTMYDIFGIKCQLLEQLKQFEKLDDKINKTFEELKGYRPYRLETRYDCCGEKREEKYIDRTCWNYLIRLFYLSKYMLCTDYEKMLKDISDFNFPVFTIENAEGYIASLKSIIYDNIKTMLKTVYQRITDETYYTGSGYSNRKKKKRNNNGIDVNFIIGTSDYSRIFAYYCKPTITDDLEKLCYIFDNQKLPDITIIEQMRCNKSSIGENKYFKIKACRNGNTHYTLDEDTRNKLNLYGGDPSRIGENIKIKIMDEKW